MGQSYNSDEFMVGEYNKGSVIHSFTWKWPDLFRLLISPPPFTRIVIILLYAIFVKDIDINNTTKLHRPSMEGTPY